MLGLLQGHWPWWISGPLLGLMVPLLLFLSNKHFGVSSSFRHICAALLPKNIKLPEYLKYNWKEKSWNLWLVVGIVIGAFIASVFFNGTQAPDLSQRALSLFESWNLQEISQLQPLDFFSLQALGSALPWILLIVGGFLVGFGTRYANGCTSGHAIMGLSLLNLGSFVAVLGFFTGGLIAAHFILPWLLRILG
jgi:uncharacterized membrane protein YedE/YeeE